MLAGLGIVKGQPFEPDAARKRIIRRFAALQTNRISALEDLGAGRLREDEVTSRASTTSSCGFTCPSPKCDRLCRGIAARRSASFAPGCEFHQGLSADAGAGTRQGVITERIEILEAFVDLPDVRQSSGKRHQMALCALLEFIEQLALKGVVIAFDTIGTQKKLSAHY